MKYFWILCLVSLFLPSNSWAQKHRMVWFGDSISVNFHFSSYPEMIYLLWTQDEHTGMVADRVDPELISVFEILKEENPDFQLANYAHAGASIVTYQNWAQQNLLQLKPLETQIDMFIDNEKEAIDSVVLWVGHNDINRAITYENCEIQNEQDKAPICEEVKVVRENYFFEINRLIKHLQKRQPAHPVKVFIVGLVNLDSFLSLHNSVFLQHQRNKEIGVESYFSYIEMSRKDTQFIHSKHKEQSVFFGESLNEDIENWVSHQNCGNLGQIEIKYVGNASQVRLNKPEYLSIDGFHPGTIGLNLLANAIGQGLLNQGIFE